MHNLAGLQFADFNGKPSGEGNIDSDEHMVVLIEGGTEDAGGLVINAHCGGANKAAVGVATLDTVSNRAVIRANSGFTDRPLVTSRSCQRICEVCRSGLWPT